MYYFYRAVDKENNTIDFLLTEKRDKKSDNGLPDKINIDKSGANLSAVNCYNTKHQTTIEIRQVKYLNNIIEDKSAQRTEEIFYSLAA